MADKNTLKNYTIMVVDNDIGMRELLYQIFTTKGYKVITAVGGEEALHLIAQTTPDMVISDYALHGMGGLAFLKNLRATNNHIPVIMLTAHDNEQIENEIRKLGVFDIIRKTIDTDVFIDSVDKFVALKLLKAKGHRKKDLIMVVDDDPLIRGFLKRFLEKKNYKVITVETAEQALDMVKEKTPSLILLDINLPGMDGLTALKKLKEMDEHLAVIMITGNANEQLAMEAISLGSYDYIRKPFNLEYLELAVLTKILLGETPDELR